MPYIKPERRQELDGLEDASPVEVGELNYLLTKITIDYVERLAKSIGCPRYGIYNAAIGALECAKLELYRRMVAPYEDQKIEENGDVYPTTSGAVVREDTPEPVGRAAPIERVGGTRGYPTSAVIRLTTLELSPYFWDVWVGNSHIGAVNNRKMSYTEVAHFAFNEDWYVDEVRQVSVLSSGCIEIHIKWAGDISVEDAGC